MVLLSGGRVFMPVGSEVDILIAWRGVLVCRFIYPPGIHVYRGVLVGEIEGAGIWRIWAYLLFLYRDFRLGSDIVLTGYHFSW